MPDTDLPTVLCDRYRSLLDRIREAEQMVHEDHPDGVHDLRVALRRTRSLLTTFDTELGEQQSARLKEELRWAGGELSPLRDLQVVHERIDGVLSEQRVELVLGQVRGRLDDHLRAPRRDAEERAGRLLESERWRSLLADLADHAGREPQGSQGDARTRLRKDWRRMRRRARRAAATVGDERAHETALHDVRKAAKRARYAAETLGPLFGSDAGAMETAAEAVQQALGDHRDTLLTRQALRLMGVQAHLDGDNGFTYGRLHALEELAGSRYLGAYEKAHAKVDKPKLRRWLS